MSSTPRAPSTVSRPPRPAAGGRPQARTAATDEPTTALLAGGRAGTAAGVLGLLLVALPTVLVWWGEDRSSTDVLDAFRSTADLWLVAHGVALQLPQGMLGLTPLGLALLPLWLCRRAGRRAADACAAGSVREALHAAGGVALLYTGLAVVVAAAVDGAAATPVLWTAVLGPAVLSGAAAATGAVGALAPSARPSLPPQAAAVLRAGSAAVLLLLAVGALLVGVSLALDMSTATDVAQASEPGAVGGLGLLLLGVSLVPNAVVWAASWLAGPGFALGAGTAVSPFAVELGPVPALPLLAGLPTGAPPGALAGLAVAVPVVAGAVAGRLLGTTATWQGLATDAAGAGLVAGGVVGLLGALSGGPLGGERLAVVGPSGWQVGTLVAVQVAAGVAAGSVLRRRAAKTSQPR